MKQRKNLDIVGKSVEPNTIIQDDEIGNTLKEVFRLGLVLDMQSLSIAINEDVSYMIWDILDADYKGYREMIKLCKTKNWLTMIPTV